MADIFDDDLSVQEFGMALGLADEIAQEERDRRRLLQDDESLVPDAKEPQWYEKD